MADETPITPEQVAEKLRQLDELKKKLEKAAGKKPPGRKPGIEGESAYESNRRRNLEAGNKKTRTGQDIGPIPEVSDLNWSRRLRCEADPELFFVTYFGFAPFFFKPFSDDHRRVIAKGEHCVHQGGNVAYAMPRGHGKTALARAFCIRAILLGLRQFALFVGAADTHARTSLSTIKVMLERSPLLAEDYPEVVYPILALEGSSKRQQGQNCLGVPTDIHWGKDYIQLPACPPQPSIRPEQGGGHGALMLASGLMGSGITGTNVNGRRPDFLCLDDPQTRQSAKSDAQCAAREEILAAMITGIAAPGVKLAAFMPCTVIRSNDMADRHLNHSLHPEWGIERCALLKTMPTNMALWEANKAIRTNFDPYAGPGDKERAATEATLHYIDNQEAMDAGAEPSWPERYNADEVSAVQNAMNLHADNKYAFFAEMQNAPLAGSLGNVKELTREEVAKRLSNALRLCVPHGATKLTAFIDVQGIGLLWYMVCAWRDCFTGYVIDYGTYPDQQRRYFTKATAPKLLAAGDQALHSGIMELAQHLLKAQYQQASGGSLMLDLLLIDSGHQAELVYEACRQLRDAGFGARILPSKGEGARSSDRRGFTEGAKVQGERRGFQWRLPPPKERRGVKLLLYETNGWKSFVTDRIAVKDGGMGSLTFFGADQAEHMMLFDHLFAEYRDRVKSERTGREIDEWHERGNQDNDLWDCLIGCAVAANVQGVVLEDIQPPAKAAKNVRDYSAMYSAAMGGS